MELRKLFTVSEKPKWVEDQEKLGNTVIHIAARPLYGNAVENSWQLPCLHGRHYAALSPSDQHFDTWVQRNQQLDARWVQYISSEVAVRAGIQYYQACMPRLIGRLDFDDPEHKEMLVERGLQWLNRKEASV